MKPIQTRKKFLFLKVISTIVVCIFTYTTVASSAPPPLVYKVQVPSKNGKMKERWKPTEESEAKPLVVHIQDAHTSLEAQENIAAIIEHFVTSSEDKEEIEDDPNLTPRGRDRRVDKLLICAEGAQGICDTTLFSSYPDQDVKEIIAHRFMEKGKFTGSEYQAIISPEPFELYGAESRDLYIENYQAYLTVIKKRDGILAEIEKIEDYLNNLKDSLFSEKLKKTDALFTDYKLGIKYIVDHIIDLFTLSQDEGIELTSYPNLFLFYEAIMRDGLINHSSVTEERSELIKLLIERNVTISNHEQFQSGEISEKEFYVYLRNLIKEHALNENECRNFLMHADYLELMSRVDVQQLMYEVRRIRWEIEDRISFLPAEKRIVKLLHNFEILKTLVNLQALYQDVEYFNEHRDEFRQEYIKECLKTICPEGQSVFSLFNLDFTLNSIEEFYSAAHERNSALVVNTLNQARKEEYKSDIVLLIAGGYHTNGITEELREQNVPYIVVTPNITKIEPDIPYEDRMLLKLTPFESLINNPATSTIAFQLLTARKPLVTWWDEITQLLPQNILDEGMTVDIKQSHERAVILALYLFGFMRFVTGDETEFKDIPEEFYKKVTRESEDQFKKFLVDNNWKPALSLKDKLSFAGKAKDVKEPYSVIFNIEGEDGRGTVTLNVEKFLTDIDTALERGGEAVVEEVVRLNSEQLTALYKTILKHLTIALPVEETVADSIGVSNVIRETGMPKREPLRTDTVAKPQRPGRKDEAGRDKGGGFKNFIAAFFIFSFIVGIGARIAGAAVVSTLPIKKHLNVLKDAKVISSYLYKKEKGVQVGSFSDAASAQNLKARIEKTKGLPGGAAVYIEEESIKEKSVYRVFLKQSPLQKEIKTTTKVKKEKPVQKMKKDVGKAKYFSYGARIAPGETIPYIASTQNLANARIFADSINKYIPGASSTVRKREVVIDGRKETWYRVYLEIVSDQAAMEVVYELLGKIEAAAPVLSLDSYKHLIRKESGGLEWAWSNAGAYGPFQFTAQSAEEVIRRKKAINTDLKVFEQRIKNKQEQIKKEASAAKRKDYEQELKILQLNYTRFKKDAQVLEIIPDVLIEHYDFTKEILIDEGLRRKLFPSGKRGSKVKLPVGQLLLLTHGPLNAMGAGALKGLYYNEIDYRIRVGELYPDNIEALDPYTDRLLATEGAYNAGLTYILDEITARGWENIFSRTQGNYRVRNKYTGQLILNEDNSIKYVKDVRRLYPETADYMMQLYLFHIQNNRPDIIMVTPSSDLSREEAKTLHEKVLVDGMMRWIEKQMPYQRKIVERNIRSLKRKISQRKGKQTKLKNELKERRKDLADINRMIRAAKNIKRYQDECKKNGSIAALELFLQDSGKRGASNFFGYKVKSVIENEALKDWSRYKEKAVSKEEAKKVKKDVKRGVEEKKRITEQPSAEEEAGYPFIKSIKDFFNNIFQSFINFLSVNREKLIGIFTGGILGWLFSLFKKSLGESYNYLVTIEKTYFIGTKKGYVSATALRVIVGILNIAGFILFGTKNATIIRGKKVRGYFPFTVLTSRPKLFQGIVLLTLIPFSFVYPSGMAYGIGAFILARLIFRFNNASYFNFMLFTAVFLSGTLFTASPAIGKMLFDMAVIEAAGYATLIGTVVFLGLMLISLLGTPSDDEPITFGGKPIIKDDFDILKDIFVYLFYNMYIPDGYTLDEVRSKFEQAIKDKFGKKFYNEKLYLDRDNFDIRLENKASEDNISPMRKDDCLEITLLFKDKIMLLPEEKIASFYIRQVYDKTNAASDAVYIDMSESFISGVDKIGLPSGIGVGTYMRKALMTCLKQIGYKRVISQMRARTKYITKDQEWGLGLKWDRVRIFHATTLEDKPKKVRYYLSVPSSIANDDTYQISEYFDHLVYLVAPDGEDEFNQEKFIGEIQTAREKVPQFIAPFKEPVYVFINDDAVTDDTICDFDGAALNSSNVYPVFFSFNKKTSEIIMKLEKLRDEGFIIGDSFSVIGKDGIVGDDLINKFKNMVIESDFKIRSDNRNVIVIDKGSMLDNLSLLLRAIHQNNLGWIGPVYADFSFSNISEQKKLIQEGKFAATVMSTIQFILKYKIVERQELNTANNLQEGILPFQGSIDELKAWQEELMAKIDELEKQAIIKQAA